MKIRERKHSIRHGGPTRPTEETAIAVLDNEPPRGQSLRDMLAELEKSHPDLGEEAPISSAAVEAGELVRSARLAAGISQRDLARAAGMHQSAVSAVECGEGKEGPSFRKLRDMADALGLRLAFVPREETGARSATAVDHFEKTMRAIYALSSLHASSAPTSVEGKSVPGSLAEKMTIKRYQESSFRLFKMLRESGHPEQANLMLLSPGSVISEISSVRRRVTRLGTEGGFIRGGSFTVDSTVSLGADVAVQIVNTGAQPLLAVSIPEPPRKASRSVKS